MSISAAINVNQILTRVAVETGLNPTQDPFGSQLQEYVQMKALLQIAGEDLCLAYPWEFMKSTLDITAQVGDTGTYPLPDDYLSLVDQTGWFVNDENPIIGSLSPQEWAAVTKNDIPIGKAVFRLMDGQISIYPTPEPPQVATFEYISRSFVRESGVGGIRKDNISIGADIILFDRTLITRYLKVLWLEAKGFDTNAAQNSFNQAFSFITSKDTAGKVISPVSRGGFRLLDHSNIQDSRIGL